MLACKSCICDNFYSHPATRVGGQANRPGPGGLITNRTECLECGGVVTATALNPVVVFRKVKEPSIILLACFGWLIVRNLSVPIYHQLCCYHTHCFYDLIMIKCNLLSHMYEASGRQQNTFDSLDWIGCNFCCSLCLNWYIWLLMSPEIILFSLLTV